MRESLVSSDSLPVVIVKYPYSVLYSFVPLMFVCFNRHLKKKKQAHWRSMKCMQTSRICGVYTWYVVKTWERWLQRLAPSMSTFWQTSFFSLSKLVLVVRTWAWTWDTIDKKISRLKISSQYDVSYRLEQRKHKHWSSCLCLCEGMY